MSQATHTSPKPVLGEDAFQQLLSAAFVLQEHNNRLRTGDDPPEGYAKILSEIADTQDLIQARRLDMGSATALIAERLRKITNASGAAVSLLQKGELQYCAGSGTAAEEVGERARVDLSLGAECVRTGRSLQSADAEKDSRLRQDLCRKKKVRALLAVPVHHESRVAGVLELRFDRTNAFGEQDLHTCQLMAAVVADVVAKESQRDYQQAVAGERAAMLVALEKIKPQLDRLTGEQETESASSVPTPIPQQRARQPRNAAWSETVICRCGHRLAENETFCGICGRPRSGAPETTATPPEPAHPRGATLQETWASLWKMHENADGSDDFATPEVPSPVPEELPKEVPADLEGMFAQLSEVESGEALREQNIQMKAEETPAPAALPSEVGPLQPWDFTESQPSKLTAMCREPIETAPAPDPLQEEDFEIPEIRASHTESMQELAADYEPEYSAADEDDEAEALKDKTSSHALQLRPLRITEAHSDASARNGSAKRAREWFETQQPARQWMARQWQAYRANIYLGAAGAVLLIVIFGWSGPKVPVPTGSTPQGHHHKAPAPPELSFMDQALVTLGLAEAPPIPQDLGDPEVKVWEDTHHALYYCPGADLYGKTPDGKYASQHEAQVDSFEPNLRKVCY